MELKPIAGAPVPADSAAARLRQMRDLAQEFTSRQTNRAGVDSDMRLLAQPIYRYEETKGDLIDGGLFVFVQGTDPEIFLLIEARRSPTGMAEWRFGATRMHGIDLRVYRHGKVVWKPPRSPGTKYRTGGSRTRSSVSRPRRVGRDPQRVTLASYQYLGEPGNTWRSHGGVMKSWACPTLTFSLLLWRAPWPSTPHPTLPHEGGGDRNPRLGHSDVARRLNRARAR